MSRQVAYGPLAGTLAGDHAEVVWHVARGERVIGPFSAIDLALAAKNALLHPSDGIWRPGLPRWFAAAEVTGLLPAESMRIPPAPEQPRPSAALAHTGRTHGTSRYETASLYDAASAARPPIDSPAQRAVTTCFPRPPEKQMQVAPAGAASRGAPNWPVPAATGATYDPQRNPLPGLIVETPSQSSVARRIADNIAYQIVRMLDLYGVKSIDDIATNERLRSLSGVTFDALPIAVRTTLNHTVGRPAIEERIFEALASIRTSALSPQARSADLRQMVLDHAPTIATAIDVMLDTATGSIKAMLASKWAALGGQASSGGRPQNRLPGPSGVLIGVRPA